VWLSPSFFNKASSKGPTSTTWIWNLHADVHAYESHDGCSSLVDRKVFSSGLAHLSVVLLWISYLFLTGSYYSNYGSWLKDPLFVTPSSQVVASVVGQDILNETSSGYYFKGIHITSGLFRLWLNDGIFSVYLLKTLSLFSC
jgi:photosystem I P700 chlorophyll a apoprotein A1